ncbi:hypothetical protein FLAN108750_03800 [Flavobacterium antarcticum]|uniref:hypothetical protein n=1 Tax=Flavobacterium antarcticum TaxID=271155 RepID=UPI0003B321D2|nr:hypothetical protein [Flavobacterium antarcticum]
MKKIDLLYGLLIGLITAFIGVYLFIALFTDYEFVNGLSTLKTEGKLGKLIALGTVLNLFVFFYLLKINKELMARGVVFATILLAVVTIFA